MSILLLPITSAIIGFAVSKILINQVKQSKSVILSSIKELAAQELDLKGLISEKIEKVDFADELEGHLGGKLVNIEKKLVAKIPMAAMFLKGSMIDDLKLQIKEELLSIIPELKKTLSSSLSDGLDMDKLIDSQLEKIDFDLLMEKNKSTFNKAAAMGTLIGFTGGLIQYLMVVYLG